MTVIEADMLNPRQLSELAGVQLNTVHAWRKRRDTCGMPEPDTFAGRTPLWRESTIVPWLRATDRIA